jgi:hypothetical protein
MANITRDGFGAAALGATVGLLEPGTHPTPELATSGSCGGQTPPDEGRAARSKVRQVASAPQQQSRGQVKTSNGLAVAGFALALLGALTSFIPIVNVLGDFLAFVGLIFGVMGLVKARSRGAGTGVSIAAIILAVAAFVISAVVNVAAVVALDSTVKDDGVAQNITSYRSP